MKQPELIQHIISKITPQVEELLEPYRQELRPGVQFEVTITVKEVPFVIVATTGRKYVEYDSNDNDLTDDDWERILKYKWKDKYRIILEMIRENGNQPTSVKKLVQPKLPYIRGGAGAREAINAVFKRMGMPYFIQNTSGRSQDNHLQVVRAKWA